MNLLFADYTIEDNGVSLRFVDNNPPLNRPSSYAIFLTDAELATVSTQPALRTLITGKLQRKIQAVGIASKLDLFIGQAVTI